MKKQFLSILVMLAMLINVMALPAFAAETLTLSVSEQTAQPGEEITVTIEVSNNTGLSSLKFEVAYDSVLTLTNVTFNSAFGAYATAPEPYKNPEPITMISPLSDVDANGVFATLTFTVSEDAAYGYEAQINISYVEDDIFDGDYNTVPMHVVNGSVTIVCPHGDTTEVEEIPSTCVFVGYTAGVFCNDCQTYISGHEEIPATGNHVDADGGWESDGENHFHTCGCDAIFDTAAHEGGEATCIAKAKCEVCGAEYGEVDGTNHGETEIRDASEPTCALDGYTGDTYCLDCGNKIADGEKIPATGNHVDADGEWESDGENHFHTCGCGAIFDTAAHEGGEATCTARAKCEVCGAEYGEAGGDNHGDTEVRGEIEASCGADGYSGDIYCTICGELLEKGEVVPATGEHNYVEIERKDATCTADGYVVYACGCETSSYTEVLPANGSHVYGEEPVIENYVKPTHEADGSFDEVFYCVNCGEELERKNVVVPMGEHNWKKIVIAPTCTDWGCTLHVCMDKNCDASHADGYKPATGHTFENYVSNGDATCTADSTKTAKCENCDATDTIADEGSAKGHGPYTVLFNNSWPTCTEDAHWAVICKTCGHQFEEAEWQNWGTINGWKALGHMYADATCTEAAACKRCGETTGKELGHTEEIIPSKEATCTEDGLTEGKKCSVCGKELVAQEVIAAPGHIYGESVIEVAPTCTEKGLKVATCVCGAKLETEIAELGHTEEIIPSKEATCTEDGLTEGKKCSVCGEELVAQEVIVAPGHIYGESVIEVAPTCTEKGLKVATCVCGAKLETEIAELGHTEEIISGKEATCTENGLTEGKKCTVCGEILVAQEEIPAHGHNFDENGNCTICGSPETGDSTVLLLVLIAMVAMTGAAALVLKKKYF